MMDDVMKSTGDEQMGISQCSCGFISFSFAIWGFGLVWVVKERGSGWGNCERAKNKRVGITRVLKSASFLGLTMLFSLSCFSYRT